MTPENEHLKALAEAAKGWNVNHAMPENDELVVEVGQMLNGEFYPVATVDCGQYDQSSQPLAKYIAAANPERILALIAENEAHSRKDAEPVAWALRREDGLILDVICPDEHDSHEGDYTLPLFLHPPEADKLLQQALEMINARSAHENFINPGEQLKLMESISTYLEGKK